MWATPCGVGRMATWKAVYLRSEMCDGFLLEEETACCSTSMPANCWIGPSSMFCVLEEGASVLEEGASALEEGTSLLEEVISPPARFVMTCTVCV